MQKIKCSKTGCRKTPEVTSENEYGYEWTCKCGTDGWSKKDERN